MDRIAHLLALALLCGCSGFTLDVLDTGHPRPRPPAPAEEPPPGPYSHLPQRTSFQPKSDVALKEGCYLGDFVLGRSQLEVTGAGQDRTIINGNLVLQTQCEVRHLTVTGDIIFEGSQARLEDVDFYGRIIDNGLQNRY